MKIRKTNSKQRATYTYNYTGIDGIEKKVVLKPGEDGVTEADIKLLHSMDDSEVYYNLKNIKPKRTDEEKAQIAQWKANYIRKETKKRGYAPNDDEVKDAVDEAFPKNYVLSLDYEFGLDDTNQDKNELLIDKSPAEEDVSPETARVRELMEQMTEKQRTVLKMVIFDEMTLTDAAKTLGTSIPNVKKHYDKAIEYIRKNY